MQVHVFASRSVANLYGLTPDQTGSNLDPTRGPWRFVRGLDLVAGSKGSVAVPDASVAIEDINTTGVHYTSAGVFLQEKMDKS